jgi:methyl-accepting chemotaxis protein
MFKGFFWKNWWLVVILTTSFVVLFLAIMLNYQFRREEVRYIQQNLVTAQLLSFSAERGYKIGVWPFESLRKISAEESTSFLWVVKPDKTIFWADDAELMGNPVPLPYDVQVEIRDSFYRESVKLIALPIATELGQEPWALLVGVSLKPISAAKREIFTLGVSLLLLVILLAGIISYLVSKKITNPLRVLVRDLGVIGKGNLDHRVEIKTGDEIEEVGQAVNQMTKDLKESHKALEESKQVLEVKVEARTKALKELAESLEEKVRERTKELQARLAELERYHRLTVGRELKMRELKEEIKKLEENLTKYEKAG